MNNLALLFVLFVTIAIISVFYWALIHVVIAKAIQYRLFALRDEARMKAIVGKFGTTDGFHDVEKFISKTIWCMPHINLFSFVFFAIRHPRISEEEKRIMNDIPVELKKCRDAAIRNALVLMMVNSPLFILISSIISTVMVPVVLLLWATGKLTKLRLYEQTEKFVDTLPSDGKSDAGNLCAA